MTISIYVHLTPDKALLAISADVVLVTQLNESDLNQTCILLVALVYFRL